jgi:phosphoserine phosphatase
MPTDRSATEASSRRTAWLRRGAAVFVCLLAVAASSWVTAQTPAPLEEPVLPSWRDTPTRERIIEFVASVSTPGNPDYVAPAARIATFDNDGTLWAEKPMYFQLFFAIDRAREQLRANPQLAEESPYREIAAGDVEALLAGGEEALLELVLATHTGMSETEFRRQVRDWIATAQHPATGRSFTRMVYQPMLELLDYLRDHDFEVWIVSGGGASFLRAWARDVYRVAPEHVIGSRVELAYEDGVLMRRAGMDHINDKGGKPVGIAQQLGRRPLMAVGNSDGDFAMLEWTTNRAGPSLGVFLHHTDAEREWAYDRESSVGRLDRGLNEAESRGWLIVDIAKDWSRVFP